MKMEIDNDFCEKYIQLRTVLDALEMNALNFVLEDKATRNDRAEKIEALVKDCYDQIAKYRYDEMEKLKSESEVHSYQDMPEMPCPQGYQYCNGVCVPYNCP
jgi:hypothetical protein